MRELAIPEWSDSKWVQVVMHQLDNWPPAIAQMVSSVATERPEIRFLRAVAQWAGWPHPIRARLPSGASVRTSDAQHLAGLLEAGWRATPKDDLLLMEEPGGARVFVRPVDRESRDLCSLFETFVRSDYGTDFSEMCVVDLGGGNGDSSICFAARGASRVITLEPDPRNARVLRRNLALNPELLQIELCEAAVTPHESKFDLLLRIPYAELAGDRTRGPPATRIPVAGVPIGELLSGLTRVDLLKIDIEGGEYEILRAIPADAWTKIGAVCLEFHQGLQDLPALFEGHGFEVTASFGVRQGLLLASKGG